MVLLLYCSIYGIKIGASYDIINRIKSIYSSYSPIRSTNKYNNELKFQRKDIHLIGLNYALD